MPIQYTSIVEEHNAVRQRAGMFDTSHMGVVVIAGADAENFLNRLTLADIPLIIPGQAKYSMFLNEKGGVIDDLIIYRRERDFVLVINAGNTPKDLAWMKKHKTKNLAIDYISPGVCMIALQGPEAQLILQTFVEDDLKSVGYFRFIKPEYKYFKPKFSMLARTGYTGEDGFEMIMSVDEAKRIWDLLAAAKVRPCGLGARDTLRLEACMPLHGHEISDSISPIEAGLGGVIHWDKDFIGKTELLKIKQAKPKTFLTALIMDSGIPRTGCRVFCGNKEAGKVTSGTYSPTLKKGIALAYTGSQYKPGDSLGIEIHGQVKTATVTDRPFYKRNKRQGQGSSTK